MYEYCRRQAEGMAKFAGISLREEQIESYIKERDKMATGKNEEEIPRSCHMSDQELLCQILKEDQSSAFRRKYPNIFPEETLTKS